MRYSNLGFRKKRHIVNLEKQIMHMLAGNPKPDHRKIEQLIERKTGSTPYVLLVK